MLLVLAQFVDKPGQENHEYGQVNILRVINTQEQPFAVGTKKSQAKIPDGINTQAEEQEAAFRFEFIPESPDYTKDYQIPYYVINLCRV